MEVVHDTVSVYIFVVFGVIFVVLGTVGNITSIIVLRRRATIRLKIRSYLIALAIFDLLSLCILLQEVFRIGLGNPYAPPTAMQCKLVVYVIYFVVTCSSWIAVAITFERLLYIVRPHMVHPQRGTTIALSLVISLVAVINIPLANIWTVIDGECDIPDVYMINPNIICTYIPAIIMVVSTIILTYTLCRRPKLGASTSIQSNTSIRLSVCINLIFLCTTFPVSIVWEVTGKIYLPLRVLFYANYSLNFVSYMNTGKIFREELKAMLCANSVCCRKSDTYTSSSANTRETAPTTDTSV